MVINVCYREEYLFWHSARVYYSPSDMVNNVCKDYGKKFWQEE